MTMKATELADLDAEELAAKLAEAREELFNLRFQNVTGQLDDPHRLREVRKDIARIFTVIRQRELAGEAVPVAVAPERRRPSGRRFGRRQRKG
ncbi:MAG TPA: 50S ribosomal protein L29 [Actinomycetes bacterium]|jgi:large subunit ribosomal protein L29|nr:50S ribosomal protein L29 [Actinomycetes bacterium]